MRRLTWRWPTALERLTKRAQAPSKPLDSGRKLALATGPRPPLPWTSSLIALLILLPSLALWRWPRPRAEGLEQLMTSASLVQSFPATPGRRLPQLWRQRLGEGLG